MATTDNLYSGLNWSDLLAQAQRDQMAQWTRNDSFDPFTGGSTNIPGIGTAQIYLQPSDGGSMWDNTAFNINNDPNAPEGYATRLYQNPDGTVGHEYYRQDNNMSGLLLPFLAAAGGYLLGPGAGGLSGIESAAPAAGWTSGYDLAMGSDLLGMTGAGAGAAATAPGWVPAEGGTGYGGGMAADVVPSTAPVTSNGWVSAEGGSGYAVDPATGAVVPVDGAPGTMNGSTWNPNPVSPVNPSGGNTVGAPTSGGATTAGTTTAGASTGGGTAGSAVTSGSTGSGILSALNSPVAATVAGAALSGLNGAHQAGTTTTTQEPWNPLQPYLRDMYANAQSTYNANRNPTAAETSALQAIQQRATAGSPLQAEANTNIRGLLGQDPTQAYGIGQANPYTGRTINVGINPMMGLNNPYLQTQIDNAQQDVIRAMQPQFAAAQRTSGSFGNSGLQETYARELPTALGRISNNMRMTDYGAQQQLQENALNRSVAAQQADLTRNSGLAQQGIQNNLSQYNNMLGLQTNAAFSAPGLASADYNDPQMMYNTARSAREANFGPLQQYQNALSGNPGTSITSPYFTNPAANILGGATAGLGLWGAANRSGLLSGGGNSYNSWLGNNSDWMNSNGFTPSGLLGSF